MSSKMTHWERVRAALKGEEVDRPPMSLWRHWPVDDETPAGLAAATLHWQREFDFDFVKFMPTGTYGIEDWGAETIYRPTDNGTRTVVRYGVQQPEQWPQLRQLEVTQGYLGLQIEALRLTAEALKDDVPILQTVFSPLTTARKLAGDVVLAHMRTHPQLLKEGLRIIAETTARFAQASLDAGAHGIFFATQNASYRVMSESEYREFGEAFDRIVFDAIQDASEFTLLHIHGQDTMFDLMATYPAHALNWHDRTVGPSLAEARTRFSGALIGGVDEWHTLLYGPEEAIRDEVHEAIAQTQGRGFMVGPGCVLPIHTPLRHLHAARAAVDTYLENAN